MKIILFPACFVICLGLLGCGEKDVSASQSDNTRDTAPATEDIIAVDEPTESAAGKIRGDDFITFQGFNDLAPDEIAVGARAEGLPLIMDDEVVPGCRYATLDGYGRDVLVMIVDGEVARIDVQGGSLAFENGIGLGSSEADVLTAFGIDGSLPSSPSKYDESITEHEVLITDKQNAIWRTKDGIVTDYRVGRKPEVLWVEGCL